MVQMTLAVELSAWRLGGLMTFLKLPSSWGDFHRDKCTARTATFHDTRNLTFGKCQKNRPIALDSGLLASFGCCGCFHNIIKQVQPHCVSLALHQAGLLLRVQETGVGEKERVRLQQKTYAMFMPGRCRRPSCESGLQAIKNPRFGASGDRYRVNLKTLFSNEINYFSR